jgi:hypothetical protein
MSKGWKCRTYYNVNPFIGLSFHETIGPIPAPPFMGPTILPHVTFDVVQGLWLGSFLSNGRHKKIISDDLLFLGRMSDAGLMVPHISIPPSWMNILTSLFGSSNSLFGSSGVSLACKNLLWGNQDCDISCTPFGPVPLSLNLCCAEPHSDLGDIVVVWGTVWVGMTFGDLLAAVLDFALQVFMDYASAALGSAIASGIGKLGKSFGKSAEKQAAKEAEEEAEKSLMARAKSAVKDWASDVKSKAVKAGKQAAGITPTDAYKEYLKKAAKVQGLTSGLEMTDEDLAKQAKHLGFSKDMQEVAGEFSEGYEKFAKKYSKYMKDVDLPGGTLKSSEERWASYAKDEKEMLKLHDFVDDSAAETAIKNSTLKDALTDLESTIKQMRKEETAWAYEWKGMKKSASRVLWQNFSKSNAFGSGTSGGLFSFKGRGWNFADKFKYNQQMSKKWYADDLTSFGLTKSSDADQWDDAYVETGSVKPWEEDYWYDSGSSSSDSAETSSDDDDYWYGTSSSSGG